MVGGFIFIFLNHEVIALAIPIRVSASKGLHQSLQERERVRYRAVERGAHWDVGIPLADLTVDDGVLIPNLFFLASFFRVCES